MADLAVPFDPRRAASMRLKVSERILLHLLDAAQGTPPSGASSELTKEGVARNVAIERRHLAQNMRPLVARGLVSEESVHLRGLRQRRRVYELTSKGKVVAIRLRESVQSETVRVQEGDRIRTATVLQLLERKNTGLTLMRLVREGSGDRIVDLGRRDPPEQAPFVEMLFETPKIEGFVGRRGQLGHLLRADGPRFIVVTGAAGMGKSSLAARALELARGSRNLFWHQIRGWDTVESAAAQVGEFLRALGRPGLSAALSGGRLDLVGRALAEDLPGTRSLMVFDDAHEASAPVQALLRLLLDALRDAPDVRILVLTRRTLRFYDSRHVMVEGIVAELALDPLKPEEVVTFFSGDPDAAKLLPLSQRLRGHPLFLSLARAAYRRGGAARVSHEIRRFLLAQVQAGLTAPERRMMEVASLFPAPVPAHVLAATSGLSVSTLDSLQGSSLLEPVGAGSFQVHETLRDFFGGMLTPPMRRRLSKRAIRALIDAGSEADRRGDFSSSSNCFLDALQLSPSRAEGAKLWELLGDARANLGDLPGGLQAYQSGAKIARLSPEAACFHRKTASLLIELGEFRAAEVEVEKGFRALPPSNILEKGWLNLMRSRVANAFEDPDLGREASEAALRCFQGPEDTAGKVEALLEWFWATGGESSPSGLFSGPPLSLALKWATQLQNEDLIGRVRTAMAFDAATRLHDPGAALQHLVRAAARGKGVVPPRLSCQVSLTRGFIHFEILHDYAAAAQDFSETLYSARKAHDRQALCLGRFYLAHLARYVGDFAQARIELESVAQEFHALGVVGWAFAAQWLAAETCLWLGDSPGYCVAVETLRRNHPGALRASDAAMLLALEGLAHLVQGDQDGALEALSRAETLSERLLTSPETWFERSRGAVVEMYHGIALRALGQEEAAAQRIDGAFEVLARTQEYGMTAFPEMRVRRITEVLRASFGSQAHGQGRRLKLPAAGLRPRSVASMPATSYVASRPRDMVPTKNPRML